jgi:hypothetical protein
MNFRIFRDVMLALALSCLGLAAVILAFALEG